HRPYGKQGHFTHTSAGLINHMLNQPAGDYEEEVTVHMTSDGLPFALPVRPPSI
ncbi:1098_t:CDS:1, partial [Ambispora leptoticha]